MQLQPKIGALPANMSRPPLSAAPTARPVDAPAIPVGFEASTPIQTPSGTVKIDALCVGDVVTTRSGASARIVSVDRRHISAQDLHACPDAAPIRFEAGALPGMWGDTALLLSGDLPVTVPAVVNGAGSGVPRSAQFPAKAFCDGGLIRHVIPTDGVHYVNLRLEGSHKICAAGIWVEADASCTQVRPSAIPSQWHGGHGAEFRPLV